MKDIACPNMELLKRYKMFPRQLDFNYMKDRYFIYIYLDPFTELGKPFEVKTSEKKVCFAYEPIYIGKGTGAGYRHNQHISVFNREKEHNQYKIDKFKLIENQMREAAVAQNHSKPWNWKDYQNIWVFILSVEKDINSLLRNEMELIKTIGTLWDNTGPLTNKIKNSNIL